MSRTPLTLALIGLACVACPAEAPRLQGEAAASGDAGDAGSADEASSAVKLAAADYCETIVDFFCPFYLRCDRMAAADGEECKRVFLETCNERFEPRDVALEQGGFITLSREGVAACRAHLESVPCSAQTLDLQGPCARMWTGSSPTGAPCGIDVESFVCAPKTICILGLDFCGKCEPAVAVGEACGDGVRCEVDGACVAGVCVARTLAGGACDDAHPCVTGARCTSGTCEGPTIVGEGQACDATRRCPYRTSCVAGECKRSSLLGEACDAARECASGRCSAGTCVSLSSDGEACAGPSGCRSGLCSKGRCAPLPSACFAK